MIKCIDEIKIEGKRVFMRLDFNVPLEFSGDTVRITDDTRIREAVPTIKHALDRGVRLILASHLGRPEPQADGSRDPKASLAPVAERLQELLGVDLMLSDDIVGDGVEMAVKHLKTSQVILLENLRYHPGEEQNDPQFCRDLARLADVYISDAFGTTHRKHASTYGVAQLMQPRGCGFLIKKELTFLNRLLQDPTPPFVAILGGSKVSDKIKTIESLLPLVDTLLIGGLMGNTFLVARGETLPAGSKQPKPEEVAYAKNLIEKAKKSEVPLLLPQDSNAGFDIGHQTIQAFRSVIREARTIFWNGPLGMFENPEYAQGTFAIAHEIAAVRGLKIVGGGDSVAAVHAAGVADKMDHISTGGGACLEFLEGKGLPGIEVLQDYSKVVRD